MIRKFEKNDINPVMQIWKNENIKAHKFISNISLASFGITICPFSPTLLIPTNLSLSIIASLIILVILFLLIILCKNKKKQ